jgi:hypothetical protein
MGRRVVNTIARCRIPLDLDWLINRLAILARHRTARKLAVMHRQNIFWILLHHCGNLVPGCVVECAGAPKFRLNPNPKIAMLAGKATP